MKGIGITIEYNVSFDPQSGYLIQGDFLPGSIPVNIPDSNKKRKQYVSLFLNKVDIEHAIDYLRCISLNNHPLANEGLFIAALALFVKCFVHSESRTALSKDGFKKFSPTSAALFDQYGAWRNKHYLHDENRMTEATAFLLVAPEGCANPFGGPPSVVWNTVRVDYIQERHQFEGLLQEILRYIAQAIDKLGDSIVSDYLGMSREDLLKLGPSCAKAATTSAPEKKR